jgi:hypothetical protein
MHAVGSLLRVCLPLIHAIFLDRGLAAAHSPSVANAARRHRLRRTAVIAYAHAAAVAYGRKARRAATAPRPGAPIKGECTRLDLVASGGR